MANESKLHCSLFLGWTRAKSPLSWFFLSFSLQIYTTRLCFEYYHKLQLNWTGALPPVPNYKSKAENKSPWDAAQEPSAYQAAVFFIYMITLFLWLVHYMSLVFHVLLWIFAVSLMLQHCRSAPSTELYMCIECTTTYIIYWICKCPIEVAASAVVCEVTAPGYVNT